MNKLNDAQRKTFQDLQKPTMSLIASFYPMSEEIKELFADMLAIYEANPTAETAKILSDKVMGREGADDKKKWIKEEAATISPTKHVAAKKKYIEEQQAVPQGVPTSGMLLVGLGVVSRAEKDALMEAQAAARLISHVEVLDNYQPKTNYQNADGSFENAFLDKPFATKIQRLEHLVNAVVNDTYTEVSENFMKFNPISITIQGEKTYQSVDSLTYAVCRKNLFLQKARNEALDTLTDSAKVLSKYAPEVSEQISSLAKVLDGRETVERDLKDTNYWWNMGDSHFWENNVDDIYKEEVESLEIAKKAKDEPLARQDYEALKEQTKGRHIEGLVAHRADQIIAMDEAQQKAKLNAMASQHT